MPTVLVADDHPQVRGWLRKLLESKGYQVLEARDGYEALAYLERAEPALAVLDSSMPEVDGLESLCIAGPVPSLSGFWRFPEIR